MRAAQSVLNCRNQEIDMYSDRVRYIGVDDADLDLFESQYPVPHGMCYNSYVLMTQQITVMNAVDGRRTDEWLQKLETVLNGAVPAYIVIQHVEPDHTGSLNAFLKRYPDTQVVATKPAHKMLCQFGVHARRCVGIQDGERMDISGMTLLFHTAPMVHWPEVVMVYVPEEETLFSADAFGTFGTHAAHFDNWKDEARRYYFNICGKYGLQVAAALRKTQMMSVATIAPLHGPVLCGGTAAEAMRLYLLWSSYQPETEGVLVAYASIHGNTKAAALCMADLLRERGALVKTIDLTRTDLSEALSRAFQMSRMLLCASSYDAGVFPPMYDFLHKLQIKQYRSRRVGILQNGSWAPTSAKTMRTLLDEMQDLSFAGPVVTITSSLHPSDLPAMEALADSLLHNIDC